MFHHGIKIWNNLSPELKLLKNKNKFKKLTKYNLINDNQYQNSENPNAQYSNIKSLKPKNLMNSIFNYHTIVCIIIQTELKIY